MIISVTVTPAMGWDHVRSHDVMFIPPATHVRSMTPSFRSVISCVAVNVIDSPMMKLYTHRDTIQAVKHCTYIHTQQTVRLSLYEKMKYLHPHTHNPPPEDYEA